VTCSIEVKSAHVERQHSTLECVHWRKFVASTVDLEAAVPTSGPVVEVEVRTVICDPGDG
jgi:hypothetical protein